MERCFKCPKCGEKIEGFDFHPVVIAGALFPVCEKCLEALYITLLDTIRRIFLDDGSSSSPSTKKMLGYSRKINVEDYLFQDRVTFANHLTDIFMSKSVVESDDIYCVRGYSARGVTICDLYEVDNDGNLSRYTVSIVYDSNECFFTKDNITPLIVDFLSNRCAMDYMKATLHFIGVYSIKHLLQGGV